MSKSSIYAVDKKIYVLLSGHKWLLTAAWRKSLPSQTTLHPHGASSASGKERSDNSPLSVMSCLVPWGVSSGIFKISSPKTCMVPRATDSSHRAARCSGGSAQANSKWYLHVQESPYWRCAPSQRGCSDIMVPVLIWSHGPFLPFQTSKLCHRPQPNQGVSSIMNKLTLIYNTHTHTHAHTHTRTLLYITHTCTHVYMHTCMHNAHTHYYTSHTCIHTHMHAQHTHTCTQTYITHTHTLIYITHTHTLIYITHSHTNIHHTHSHTHIHTHTHTHTHTHIHTHHTHTCTAHTQGYLVHWCRAACCAAGPQSEQDCPAQWRGPGAVAVSSGTDQSAATPHSKYTHPWGRKQQPYAFPLQNSFCRKLPLILFLQTVIQFVLFCFG